MLTGEGHIRVLVSRQDKEGDWYGRYESAAAVYRVVGMFCPTLLRNDCLAGSELSAFAFLIRETIKRGRKMSGNSRPALSSNVATYPSDFPF